MKRKNIITPLLLIFITIYPASATVKINEFMVNPKYESNQGESYGSNEYIELYNLSAFPISLTDWYIVVDGEAEPLTLLKSPFCPLSVNLIIQPYSYAIVFAGSYKGCYQQQIYLNKWGTIPLYLTTKNSRIGKYGLNNNKGKISLLNPEGQIVSEVEWQQPLPFNQSKEKINPNGNDELYNWRLAPENSPGFANSSYRPHNQITETIFKINKPLCLNRNGSYNNWYATIKLQDNQIADLELFNLQGVKVQSLLHNFQLTGSTTVSWIKDNNQIGSGIHLLRLTIRSTENKIIIYQKIKKLIIVTLK